MEQISKLVWREPDVPEELHDLLRTVGTEYAVSDTGAGLKLNFRRIDAPETTVRVSRSPGEVLVEYSTVSGAARGLGSALAGIECAESTPFKTLGIMLDVSRNMVMKVDHLKMWFRRLALSGCNMVMLYAEDVYRLPEEPFFGYLRGAYSMEEIRELDAYARLLGIELIGCIQTLGHLEQMLRWPGAYREITDTPGVLMVDHPDTYRLIGKMIAFWSEALGSRRIHIGMDETHDLGRGRYLDHNGYDDGFSLFNRHLAKVYEICKSHHLKPMLWSDMYFRLCNPERDYYDLANPVPADVKTGIPADADLVYWDYYHTDQESYEAMIRRHRDLGREPLMGSAIWTWVRFWYDHTQTMKTVIPCINACRKLAVRELFFTMWGDDGAYCNYDSALAGIVRCADLAFGAAPDDDGETVARFAAVCGGDYRAHLAGARLYAPLPGNDVALLPSPLVWDDPLLGIYYDDMRRLAGPEFDLQLIARYREMLCELLPHRKEAAAGNFGHLINILKLLTGKLELRRALAEAYRSDDRAALRKLAGSRIPAVIAAVREFDASFRAQWLNCAKVFGLEVIQARNATLIARLEETALRIGEYLDGRIERIDELEDGIETRISNNQNWYRHVASATVCR